MGENKKHTRVPRCVGKEVSLLIKLVEKAINGDEESFRCLVQQRKEAVYRIAYSYVKNPDDALDIVQEKEPSWLKPDILQQNRKRRSNRKS
jgi:hypothetical protein